LKRAKVGVKYEAEKIPYVIAGHYKPDFIIETPSGKIYIEAKGYFRPEHKRKMAAVKRQHPEKDIRIVFYRKSKSNERWAIKHGFPYSFATIPKEWLL
jgi:predicted nuclease of restriction endonuclease-like RecB superfamily